MKLQTSTSDHRDVKPTLALGDYGVDWRQIYNIVCHPTDRTHCVWKNLQSTCHSLEEYRLAYDQSLGNVEVQHKLFRLAIVTCNIQAFLFIFHKLLYTKLTSSFYSLPALAVKYQFTEAIEVFLDGKQWQQDGVETNMFLAAAEYHNLQVIKMILKRYPKLPTTVLASALVAVSKNADLDTKQALDAFKAIFTARALVIQT